MGYTPATVPEVQETVSVVPDVELVGEYEPVQPTGKPLVEKLTLFVNPFAGKTVMPSLPFVPRDTVNAADAGTNVNVAAGFMIKVAVVVAVALPEVPVMVTG